ncbi:MAG: transcription antitermination factor NusB [Bacteroidetes bacterium RIFCSPLOWO2_12_FULL_35_15]|nr:MAG: transcription antitermination factor NusB [Bacteroidetes bacterium RIFCSPLOWO2_12_FULL_35_15]
MLNRRFIRIKVMQALYGFFQSDSQDLAKAERELFKGIDKIYDLYIYQLAFLIELRHVASILMEDAKNKRLPTKDDLDPNLKFIENKFIAQLAENIHLQREMNNRKINWNNEFEFVKKVYNIIKASDEFGKYMNVSDNSYKTDRDFIADIFKEYIADYELINHIYEERNLHWGDDIYIVNPMIVKTIESFKESSNPDFQLLPLYKDEEEDEQFIKDLFRQTILKTDETEKLIGDKTQNWEVERIAMMDVLLMKMAITEILHFSNIPVKVTLNEFIEISKMYSTPKSKIFINGILDKLLVDFKSGNMLNKMGRGLME